MPSINMIAARRAEKQRLAERTKNLVYAIVAEAGLFMVALSFMVVQLVSTQGQVGSLNEKITKLKPQVLQIQSLQEQTAQLQPKLVALTSAKDSTLYWYTAVQNLSSSLADTCWLSNLQTTGDPAQSPGATTPGVIVTGPQMNIAGLSLNQADVGQMMLRMNQHPHFQHVTLNFVQQVQSGPSTANSGENPVQFQISVQLRPTAQPAKAGTTGLGGINAQKS